MVEVNGVVDGHGIGRDNTEIVATGGPDAVRALEGRDPVLPTLAIRLALLP